MNKKYNVLLVFIVLLLIISVLSQNQIVSSLSTFGVVLIIVIMKITDCIYRAKLINTIKKDNLEYIKVKENNKWMILLILCLTFNLFYIIKPAYQKFKIQDGDNFINTLSLINDFTSYEKLILLIFIVFIINAILLILQVLFNESIVSKDNVIFYDGVVFEINKIEEIEYNQSSILKNRKVIKLGKGFFDRKIIVDIEDFDKVKNLLEVEITQ